MITLNLVFESIIGALVNNVLNTTLDAFYPTFLLLTHVFLFLQGIGTDEDALIEIMCSRSNAEIHKIRESYKRCKYMYKTTVSNK